MNSDEIKSHFPSPNTSTGEQYNTSNCIELKKKPKRKGGNYKGRKRPNHPPKVTKILKEWLANNKYPFPTNTEKSHLCELTGLTPV